MRGLGCAQFSIFLLLAYVGFLSGCGEKDPCQIDGQFRDEAMCIGREAESLEGSAVDYFADMDYGVSKDPAELVRRLSPYVPGITEEKAVEAFAVGRNNWIVWTAGNDRLWDELSKASFGNLDFLKTISNYPGTRFSRDNRWQYFGLVNEPCYKKGAEPRQDRWGLYLDVRDENCGPDPFENEEKYPGVKIGARGEGDLELGSYYGYGTGIVGLRLFPNPDFDAEAQKKWDPVKYYTDKDYYLSKDLVKPYRVGMSCGFCHVGPNPSNPPVDPENPTWANLNSNPGAQYFWIDRIFMWAADESNYVYQLFHTSRPGALDTSLVSSDYINNPRTMNAVYNLGARLELAARFGEEKLTGGERDNKQLNEYAPAGSPLNNFYKEPDTVFTPRVLKDGADSVGAIGALNRVFINIGLFSEEWLTHFRPLVGGKEISPIEIKVGREYSSYWQATEAQTADLALFFLASARPDHLSAAPGGEQYLQAPPEQLERGKEVFAETCARCHSSKLPEGVESKFPAGCNGSNYLACFSDYWEWSKSDAFKEEMTSIVKTEDFLDNNFLSTEFRIPVSLLETNACSPLATNAIEDNIWDNFSSTSYKDLPSVGVIKVQHPISGEQSTYEMPAGGRGYTRPASLVSVWSTAPFLLNNSLGKFNWSGSVDDRVDSFRDSIEKLLWPELRSGDFTVVTASGKEHPGVIDRTEGRTFLRISKGYLPEFLAPLQGFFARWLPWIADEDGISIGPIPPGTPINLISNIDMDKKKDVLKVLLKAKHDLKAAQGAESDQDLKEAFSGLVDPLVGVSKCPDYVVNKGHYFGTDYLNPMFDDSPGLSDADKEALISFLLTF
ncbi:c-type cytochrome [Haliea sp. E17]|uniref:c-type cytochrome n=1 Tax=Haliea sp. E17 TaxID=3401576 RepID=UPI003AAFEBBE